MKQSPEKKPAAGGGVKRTGGPSAGMGPSPAANRSAGTAQQRSAHGVPKKEKAVRTAAFLILLLLAALGRAVMVLYNAADTDVAYPAWVASAAKFAADSFVAARIAAGFAIVTRAVFHREGVLWATAAPLLAAFADYASRFVIDLSSGAITGVALLAAVNLLTQFLYEAILVGLAYCAAKLTARRRAASETSLGKKKYSPERAVTWATLLYLATQVLLEAVHLADFLTTYTDVTNAEVASIVGTFIKLFVICGGIAWLAAILMLGFLNRGTSGKK